MKQRVRVITLIFGAALMVLGIQSAQAGRKPKSPDLAEFSQAVGGAHVRVVWTQATKGMQMYLMEPFTQLWGLDSRDGKGPRIICKKVDSYQQPLLTHDGKRVVFTDVPERKVRVVNFDGSDMQDLVDGRVADVWFDKKTGIEWVYGRKIEGNGKKERASGIFRVQLDNPKIREDVWTKTDIDRPHHAFFEAGHDGTYAVGSFPWPKCGIAQLPNGEHRVYGTGCWPTMTPHKSGVFGIFDGNHKMLKIFDRGGANPRTIPINDQPGAAPGKEVYFPRWTNDPEFIVLRAVVDGVDTWVGQFNPAYTKIVKWYRLTKDTNGHTAYPDVWIDQAKRPKWAYKPAKQLETPKQWPAINQGLMWAWKKKNSTNGFNNGRGKYVDCKVQAFGKSVYGPHGGLDVASGGFRTNLDAGAFVREVKKTGEFTVEFCVTPLEAPRGRGTILALATEDGKLNLDILQDRGRRLGIRMDGGTRSYFGWMRGKNWKNKGNEGPIDPNVKFKLRDIPLRFGTSYHVVLTASQPDKALRVWVDGQFSEELGWDDESFEPWHDDVKLVIGQYPDGQWSWTGRLDGIALYTRAVDDKEARLMYLARKEDITSREPAGTIEVEAILKATSPIYDKQKMGTYRRLLVTNTYQVKRVLKGTLTDKTIGVRQWAILDDQVLPRTREWQKGKSFRLKLQGLDDNPQLEGERVSEEIEDLTMPVLLDIERN